MGSYFLLIGKRMAGVLQLQDYLPEYFFSGPLGNALYWYGETALENYREMLTLVETQCAKDLGGKKITSERHEVWNCLGFGSIRN